MNLFKIKDNVYKLGAVDWNRRLFDSLIPIPKGTSYNAYLIEGSEKTVLLDTVEPLKWSVLEHQLSRIGHIDYVVAHHAEQDHSGSLGLVLKKYPQAKIITNAKAKSILIDLLLLPEDKFELVEDEQTFSLGNKTLQFYLTPWVHWPETMVTYLVEDKILFSCDFFGSHLATSRAYTQEEHEVYDAAKRYYAEIMMPYAAQVKKNLDKVRKLDIDLIAPSHGPMYQKPAFIMDAYEEWVSDKPKNKAIIAYISMHGSIEKMAEYLTSSLVDKGVEVKLYDLTVMDLGEVAADLVDAASIIIGTPIVLGGVHPNVMYAAYTVNALQPKAKFASILTSYGWGGKGVEEMQNTLRRLKVELLPCVASKGFPKAHTFQELEQLAETIRQKHATL